MNVMCRHCQALFFRDELQSCCKNGQVNKVLFRKLKEFEDIPQFFQDLYDGRSEYSKEFFDNIRILNTAYSLTSLGVSKHLSNERHKAIRTDFKFGGFTMVIHGQLFHQISPLLPRPGTAPTFSQVLFYDSEYELKRRKEVCSENKVAVSDGLLTKLQQELHRVNKLYKNYKAVGTEIIRQSELVQMEIVEDFEKLKIRKAERKLYNRPSANDLAGLLNSDQKFSRDIVVQKHGDHLERISESHPAIDAMGYVLLFPNGDLGWSPNMTYQVVVKVEKWPAQDSSEECVLEARLRPVQPLLGDQIDSPEPINEQHLNDSQLHGSTLDSDDDFLDGYKRVSIQTKAAALTLFIFMNFFLHVRKDCFNLLFKCK